ncbi:hypothetical protein BGC07_04640 [Piscirickettsia litoralis]|uniref:Solute-binding protein family 3/N-terminal domain-containing protein n=2 Tax=Piscirickettsia litoralis TaxID=1891921 RepID=A0ABX3A3W9_9GAMM|nr:hypothetical protein BGC07_04640 [Piscirickettsia litoralis]
MPEILIKDQADLFVYGDASTPWRIKNSRHDPKQFEVVYRFKRPSMAYFAFNKSTPDAIFNTFKKAFEKTMANKEKIQNIYMKYGIDINQQ